MRIVSAARMRSEMAWGRTACVKDKRMRVFFALYNVTYLCLAQLTYFINKTRVWEVDLVKSFSI